MSTYERTFIFGHIILYENNANKFWHPVHVKNKMIFDRNIKYNILSLCNQSICSESFQITYLAVKRRATVSKFVYGSHRNLRGNRSWNSALRQTVTCQPSVAYNNILYNIFVCRTSTFRWRWDACKGLYNTHNYHSHQKYNNR